MAVGESSSKETLGSNKILADFLANFGFLNGQLPGGEVGGQKLSPVSVPGGTGSQVPGQSENNFDIMKQLEILMKFQQGLPAAQQFPGGPGQTPALPRAFGAIVGQSQGHRQYPSGQLLSQRLPVVHDKLSVHPGHGKVPTSLSTSLPAKSQLPVESGVPILNQFEVLVKLLQGQSQSQPKNSAQAPGGQLPSQDQVGDQPSLPSQSGSTFTAPGTPRRHWRSKPTTISQPRPPGTPQRQPLSRPRAPLPPQSQRERTTVPKEYLDVLEAHRQTRLALQEQLRALPGAICQPGDRCEVKVEPGSQLEALFMSQMLAERHGPAQRLNNQVGSKNDFKEDASRKRKFTNFLVENVHPDVRHNVNTIKKLNPPINNPQIIKKNPKSCSDSNNSNPDALLPDIISSEISKSSETNPSVDDAQMELLKTYLAVYRE